jgi:hypothetical protein
VSTMPAQATAGASGAERAALGDRFDSHHGPIDLSPANTTVGAGWGTPAMALLGLLGLAFLGATLYAGMTATDAKGVKHALFSYHTGVMAIVTFSLGGLALTMIWRAFKAGWSVTLRRQAENMAILIPIGLLLLLPYLLFPGKVWKWMDPAYPGGYLLEAKRWWLSGPFLGVRVVVYGAIWSFFAFKMYGLSRGQDATGDKTLTNRAQWWSMPGLLTFALSMALFSFDLIMALDYHWFSTMFGVYFFAGSVQAGTALVILITAVLRMSGRLKGLVTSEHYHDLGKMLLAFTVFWAYIAFSQYFLIWYASIPEETAWFMVRTHNGWQNFFYVMIFGHFILPFLLLLWRGSKRAMPIIALLAAWQLAMHLVDLFWQIRPIAFMTYTENASPLAAGKVGLGWVDITGVLGPICIWVAALIFVIRRSPLVPTKDPRMVEALNHKNYV